MTAAVMDPRDVMTVPAGELRPWLGQLLGITSRSVTAATEGIPEYRVRQLVARAGDATTARRLLNANRRPDMRRISLDRGSTYDADNPWDLD